MNYIFEDADEGVVLLNYTTDGKEHYFMKRSIKRAIFFQILLFSMSGLYTMFVDKNQELIVFATENIYHRETGTASNRADSAIDASNGADSAIDASNGADSTIDASNRANSAINEWLKWRVKWGQRGVVVFCLAAIICFVASESRIFGFFIATIVFSIIALLCVGMFYYKNVSFVVVKQLLCEANVVVILLSTVCNCIINIVLPYNPFSATNGIVYLLFVNCFVFQDALQE